MIIRIKAGIPGIADVIRSNTEIRKNVVLAEKGFILVKSDFYNKFREILAGRGYLI